MEHTGVRQIKGDYPDNRGQRTTLLVRADTETGQPRNGKGKIVVSLFIKILHIAVAGVPVDIRKNIFRICRQQFFVAELADDIIFTKGYRKPGNDKHVRSVGVNCLL